MHDSHSVAGQQLETIESRMDRSARQQTLLLAAPALLGPVHPRPAAASPVWLLARPLLRPNQLRALHRDHRRRRRLIGTAAAAAAESVLVTESAAVVLLLASHVASFSSVSAHSSCYWLHYSRWNCSCSVDSIGWSEWGDRDTHSSAYERHSNETWRTGRRRRWHVEQLQTTTGQSCNGSPPKEQWSADEHEVTNAPPQPTRHLRSTLRSMQQIGITGSTLVAATASIEVTRIWQ